MERTERGIVQGLIRHMKAQGFSLHSVDDGGETFKAPNEARALDTVLSVGESRVYFQKEGFKPHFVMLICGNGDDIISDYADPVDKTDGFAAAVHSYI